MLRHFNFFLCRLMTFFNEICFKISVRNNTRVSNGLDPDQDRHSVGPDLGPNCLQMLSADDKSKYNRTEQSVQKDSDQLRKNADKTDGS